MGAGRRDRTVKRGIKMKKRVTVFTAAALIAAALSISGCSGSSPTDKIRGKWTAETVLENDTAEPVEYITMHWSYDFYDETHVREFLTRDDVDEPYENEGEYRFEEDTLYMFFSGDCFESMQKCSFADDGSMIWGENDKQVRFTRSE